MGRVAYLRNKQESLAPRKKCQFILVVIFQTNCVTFLLRGLMFLSRDEFYLFSTLDPMCATFLYCFHCVYIPVLLIVLSFSWCGVEGSFGS